MDILYISDKNIGNMATIRIIELQHPGSQVFQRTFDDVIERRLDIFNGNIANQKNKIFDICIIDGLILDVERFRVFNDQLVCREIPILIIATKKQPLHKFLNLLKGVHGIVEFDSGIDFFLNAMKVVCAGGFCYSWDIYSIRTVYSDYSLYDDDYCESIGLSKREIEVFKMLLNGLSNKDISLKLSRSQKTIGAHKSNILRKIGSRKLPVVIPKD
ncbi:LuxR C-terminal-related transcriptional regulator [Enterobacter bugandensis]|uniref:helix-turn-helix transcriptional regulator n=1 Tax=Enterobacter bugandensis TaxID=881260 RepID=UPI0023AED9B5|nr:LuxR C-terminal-related transcriptional regulator [Enterobacter bugandensis]